MSFWARGSLQWDKLVTRNILEEGLAGLESKKEREPERDVTPLLG